MLEFRITEQNTIRVDRSKVVADFTKFIEFKLELPENWEGLTVNGLFYREEDETLGMVENIVSGEVRNLPSAPFKGEEFGQYFKVFISFVGTGADGRTATSSVYELTVQPSGLSGMNVTPEGDEENPFARFLRLVEEERKKAEAAAKTAAEDAIEQLQPSIDEIISAAGSASESAKNAAGSEKAAAGSAQSAASDAAKAAQDRADADQAVTDAEAAKQAANASALAAAASQAAAAENEKKTDVDATKTGQDRTAAEQAASDAAAAKETAIQKAAAAEQYRLQAAESEQAATDAAEQSNVRAAAAERAAEAAQAAKKTAEEKASAAAQSEQAAADSEAKCVEASDKVSRAEAAAVRAEQAADSIQEAVDANNAAQAAKTETISAKNATIAAAQTAQLEAEKVQKIVAGNEAYTKTESDLKYTVAPRKEASSDTGELKLTDADDGLSYLELQGNSEQYTNTGNKNLIDLEYQKLHGINENRYLNVNGVLTTPALDKDWKVSYYIKVKPSTVYAFTDLPTSSVTAIAFYTQDKTFISAITNEAVLQNGGTTTTPPNCEYMRVSYRAMLENTLQLEEGNVATAYIKGAVDTPSPEYPSEVKSVGDIPKDVNGVEIRNLLDEQSFINATFTEVPNIWYSIDKIEFPPGTYLINGWIQGDRIGAGSSATIMFSIDKNASTSGEYIPVIAGDGAVIKGATMTIPEGSKGYILVARAVSEKLNDIYSNYRLMITTAAEIDEYRPYIGENNGVVKLESRSANHVDAKNALTKVYSAIETNQDCSEIRVTQLDVGKAAVTYVYFNYVKGEVYTLYYKAKFIELSGIGGQSVIGIRKNGGSSSAIMQNIINTNNTINEAVLQFTATQDDLAVMLYAQANINASLRELYVYDLMVVEGTKTLQEMQAFTFQPYHQQITWIPLREPLRGITGNDLKLYADKVDKEGHVIQNIYCIEGRDMQYFNTDPSGINISDNPYKWAYWAPGKVLGAYNGTKSVLCNMLKRGTYNVNKMAITNTSVIAFNLPNTLTGLANTETDGTVIFTAIRAWVYTNNPLVYYALNKPIEYQIPAIYIETYDQETNIRCLNKVKPSSMGLDYKIAISSLIKRLEALETTAVQEVTRNV